MVEGCFVDVNCSYQLKLGRLKFKKENHHNNHGWMEFRGCYCRRVITYGCWSFWNRRGGFREVFHDSSTVQRENSKWFTYHSAKTTTLSIWVYPCILLMFFCLNGREQKARIGMSKQNPNKKIDQRNESDLFWCSFQTIMSIGGETSRFVAGLPLSGQLWHRRIVPGHGWLRSRSD